VQGPQPLVGVAAVAATAAERLGVAAARGLGLGADDDACGAPAVPAAAARGGFLLFFLCAAL
jgi:hypothetical protein